MLESITKPFLARVREWYKEIFNEVRDTGLSCHLLDIPEKCFGDITKDHAMFRGLVAHQPQNLSVEVLNQGLLRF